MEYTCRSSHKRQPFQKYARIEVRVANADGSGADGTSEPRFDCLVAYTRLQRLRGLLATQAADLKGTALLLKPCSSIHTFGMHYPIDVAFLDAQGYVLRSERTVGAAHVLTQSSSVCVLERPAQESAWLQAAQRVVFLQKA